MFLCLKQCETKSNNNLPSQKPTQIIKQIQDPQSCRLASVFFGVRNTQDYSHQQDDMTFVNLHFTCHDGILTVLVGEEAAASRAHQVLVGTSSK